MEHFCVGPPPRCFFVICLQWLSWSVHGCSITCCVHLSSPVSGTEKATRKANQIFPSPLGMSYWSHSIYLQERWRLCAFCDFQALVPPGFFSILYHLGFKLLCMYGLCFCREAPVIGRTSLFLKEKLSWLEKLSSGKGIFPVLLSPWHMGSLGLAGCWLAGLFCILRQRLNTALADLELLMQTSLP